MKQLINQFGIPTKVDTSAAAARLAEFDILGHGRDQCQKMLSNEFDFNFSRGQLERLRTKDTYVRVKEEHDKTIVKAAVTRLRADTSRLVPKIITAIEHGLDANDLKAITPALKILGIEVIEPQAQQAQAIQVIFPDTRSKPESEVIDVNPNTNKSSRS